MNKVKKLEVVAAAWMAICIGGWCYVDGPVESAQVHGTRVNDRSYSLRVYGSRGEVYQLSGGYEWWDQSYQSGHARGVGRLVRP